MLCFFLYVDKHKLNREEKEKRISKNKQINHMNNETYTFLYR